MKRTDLESKFSTIQRDAKTKMESNPVGAFFIGLVVGIALTWFRALLVPALLLGAIAGIVMWLFAQGDDEEFAESESAVPNDVNGSSRSKKKKSDESAEAR